METTPQDGRTYQEIYAADQAARTIRWQISIADFRRLTAMAEKTAANAREIARVADDARHRVLSTCHLGEDAVANVAAAHFRYLSSSAALSAQNTQNTALLAQEAHEMVSASCARQMQPDAPAPDSLAPPTDRDAHAIETQVVYKAHRAVVEADRAVQVAYRAVQDAERDAISVHGAVRGAEYAARLAAIAADYAHHAARVMQSRHEWQRETETR